MTCSAAIVVQSLKKEESIDSFGHIELTEKKKQLRSRKKHLILLQTVTAGISLLLNWKL